MKVELLYFDGCPSWVATDLALREALQRLGRTDVTIDRVRVETPQEAEARGFVGSPTVLIDGRDPLLRWGGEGGARVPTVPYPYRTCWISDC